MTLLDNYGKITLVFYYKEKTMLNIIPTPKSIEYKKGFLSVKAISQFVGLVDQRILTQIAKLPTDSNGVSLTLNIDENNSENYTIEITTSGIVITANGIRGGFYAIQTLRQIFTADKVPCVTITDYPSLEYRGFYHDITRGKIPTLDTLKSLIDDLAYLKYNSLQLYVEHVFEFSETQELIKKTGYITKAELIELDAYCKQNFIDFVPSLSTFGHMYEILMEENYKHLRVLKDYIKEPNEWWSRQMHHTIDPTNPQSIELVKSLIDQYAQNFTSDYFNICCDETFDLKQRFREQEKDLYINFVKQIIAHVKSKGKKVMMWADILLIYPETINDIPKDTIFLNWDYSPNPSKEKVEKFKALGKTQIVCPGNWSWNNFVEKVFDGEANISKMSQFSIDNGALGMLVTNWGDYNNICSLENSRYSLFLGAEKCWNPSERISQDFYASVNRLAFGFEKAMDYYMQADNLQKSIHWYHHCEMYSHVTKGLDYNHELDYSVELISQKQQAYVELYNALLAEKWDNGDYKCQLINAIQGIMLIVETNAIMSKTPITRLIDIKTWLNEYTRLWLKSNKPSELYRVVKLFEDIDKM